MHFLVNSYYICGMFTMILKNVIAHLSYDSKCRLLRDLSLLKTISLNSSKIVPQSRLERLLIKCLSLSWLSSMIARLEKLVQMTLFAPSMLPQSSEVDPALNEKVSEHWTPDPIFPPHNF